MFIIAEYFHKDHFILPHTTCCKHKYGDCEECGTSNKRDYIHHTKNGIGEIGRLLKKNKKSK